MGWFEVVQCYGLFVTLFIDGVELGMPLYHLVGTIVRRLKRTVDSVSMDKNVCTLLQLWTDVEVALGVMVGCHWLELLHNDPQLGYI